MSAERVHLEDIEDSPVQFTAKGKGPSGGKGHIDMTPMVDVVFQLLTFFLLAVKRDSQEPLEVPMLMHTQPTAVLEEQATFIIVKPAPPGESEAQIVLGISRRGKGETVTLDQVKSEVEKGVASSRPNIIIKGACDHKNGRHVRHGDMARVMRIVANVEGTKLYVGVQAKE